MLSFDEQRTAALQNYDEAARFLLLCQTDLRWTATSNAKFVATAIWEIYEAFPELDLVTPRRFVAEAVALGAIGSRFGAEAKLLMMALASGIDPGWDVITDLALPLAAKLGAENIVTALCSRAETGYSVSKLLIADGGRRLSIEALVALAETLLRSRLASNGGALMRLGDDLDRLLSVQQGECVTKAPGGTAQLVERTRRHVRSGHVSPAAGGSSRSRNIVSIASRITALISSVVPAYTIVEDRSKPRAGEVSWITLRFERDIYSIPARLLKTESGRRNDDGSVSISRGLQGPLVWSPELALSYGYYQLTCSYIASGEAIFNFGPRTRGGRIAIFTVKAKADGIPHDTGVCEFLIPRNSGDVELVLEVLHLSGRLTIDGLELRAIGVTKRQTTMPGLESI